MVLATVLLVPGLATGAPDEPTREELAWLAGIVRNWQATPRPDLHHLRALRALAARTAGHGEGMLPAVAAGRAWPVAGPIVARFGEPDGPSASEAVRIAASGFADVRAPAAGRVVFADHLSGVGLVLIIDHGDEYHSVLAGLSAIVVQSGADVEVGQPVGRMLPGTYSADLHVEVRRRGRPVDPLPWLGVDERGDG
ncbi:MAG: murein hydrolase activator EnvC family protein [Pseudomonadota bacterium]